MPVFYGNFNLYLLHRHFVIEVKRFGEKEDGKKKLSSLGHFVPKSPCDHFNISNRMAGIFGSRLVNQNGTAPVDSGHIAQKSRPVSRTAFCVM